MRVGYLTGGVIALGACLSLTPARPVCAGTAANAVIAPQGSGGCAGDCNGNGQVTVDEVLLLVNIALGNGQLAPCAASDLDQSNQITVDEILAAVQDALSGCPSTGVPTPTPTVSPTATATITPGGPLQVAEAVARDSHEVAIHLNQTVTTEGIVTVAAGALANKKLKIFVQDGGAGIMVYHPDAGSVDRAFQPGDRIRAGGKIIQADPGGENLLTGTVMIDVSVSGGSWTLLSAGNPVPAPQPVTLHGLAVNGIAFLGTLVRVDHVQKVAGNWPSLGGQTTSVTVSDDAGATQLNLRLQKNTFTSNPAFVNRLNSIGGGPFTLVGIAVQNAIDGNLMGNFEVWIRGGDDITTP